MDEPDRSVVLAWLFARPERTVDDAITKFWGTALDDEARTRIGARIRQWKSRARRTDTVDLVVPASDDGAVEPAPAPARRRARADDPTHAGRPVPIPPHPTIDDDSPTFLRRQLDQLLIDVEEARSNGQLHLVPSLDARISAVREKLEKARPLMAGGGRPPRPLVSDEQLATMTPAQLSATITALVEAGPALATFRPPAEE